MDVTEKRQTQEALRQSEALSRDMADHAPAMVWVTDPEGSCTFLSETWYEFTGQTQETGLGLGWLSAIHPDDREAMRFSCALAQARREAYRLEYRLRHVSGDYRRVLVVATPRFGSNCEFIGYIGSVLDLTEYQRANEAARNTAERLQMALRVTELGTWDYFPESGSLIWDERCKALFGLPLDATVDYDMFLAGLHPDDRERTNEMVKRALDPSGDGAIDIEYRTIGLLDRIERCVHATGRTFFEDGVPVRFVGTVQEITDRKRADEAMQRLASIVESSEDAIISKDLNGIIMSWNQAAERIFGYQADEVLGKPVTMLIPPDRQDEEPGILSRIRQGKRVRHYETVRRRKDGQLIDVSLTVSPVKDPKGHIIGVSKIARDITERKRTERDLQEAKDAAEAANRSKDKFLAVLSHELRTPLTPVLMTAAVREKDPNLPPAVRADMAMIRRNVELETKLIDDLLDLSRITSGKFNLRLEPVDLNAVVGQVCDICRSQIQQKGIRLRTDLDATIERVAADSSRLPQVLWNVLKNAAKFTPEGGSICVRTSTASEGRLRVEVRDTGAGIAPEQLPKIFDAFEQGDVRVTRQFGGLGLGLAISKALVELHRGAIRVESAGIGEGCTVTIEIPGASSAQSDPMAVTSSRGKRSTETLRLLVVEDHSDTALMLGRLLEASGYKVKTAGNVSEALELVDREPFDVLVSDLGLPDATGFELMRRIGERHTLKGIAISGYGMDEDIRKSLEAGFSEHLVKPVDVLTLERAILRLV